MSFSEIHHEFEFTSNITDPSRNRYDVYLSFCDQDSRSVALSIYTALTSKHGVVVFWDDQWFESEDRTSKQPSDSTLNVIGDCEIVVIVFSKNYFNSRWCLKELEKITECCQRTKDGLIVLPFFYDGVYPSYKSLQRDMYGEGFHAFLDRISTSSKDEDEDKFMTWVAAITNEASKYHELDYLRRKHQNEGLYIQNVAACAARVLNNNRRGFLSNFCTGSINSCAQDVIQLLKQSKSPLLLGIWGVAGIGKSTIAKTIYYQIGPYFEYNCFLNNVRWKDNDQVSLQQELLPYIDEPSQIKILTVESGRVMLKKRLQNKRVLFILDDVNKLEQLNALCGSREWFGEGSKIIIITRDRHLLKEHGVDNIYRVNELDESESFELFNAFSLANPPKDSGELSKQIVAYSGGWPLALIELGMFLRGKEVLEWKGVLSSLEIFSIPAPRLLEALEKSFSDLSDEEKQIFLDIACFFIGMDQNDVIQTLNRSIQCTTLQINLLEDKSLVTLDENNKLQMHVLLQAMARDIITRESSNKTDQPKMYDVFLSFRGGDSRAKFMSHLCSSLQNAGIYAFRDDDEIQRGDQISISLLRAIGQSKISIIVLSTNYANSRWCMLELEKIMKIGRTKGLVVVPVFYEVDPSEVRHQKGRFGKAFKKLISKISVDESTKSNWRRDLFDIGGIAGFVLIGSRNESADIKNIVEHVTHLLDRTELFVAEHPVGLESRVEAAIKLLNIQKSEDVLLLGIWGMGGTGKTTIAKAIYNEIGSKFEGRSFLLDIREFCEADTSQVSLQQQVLCDVYKTTSFKIRDIESGKNMLKQRLAQKRVLFVLDDVNELDQLKALCGSREWFGSGSRIIITTRDMHLLRLCRVDEVYAIEEMDKCESLELFSWHAFKQPSPTEDLATHSADVIAYSGGLPLALAVLGSHLSDCEITEWQKVLEKLKCIPHDQVQKKLRGAEVVKGLALKFSKENIVRLNSKAFKKMYKLRLLQFAGVKLKGDFKHLSGNLRWLYWHGFPLTYTPAEFQQESLVAIELKYSNLTQMWKKNKMLKNLKILNLSHSHDLTETPDFTYMPNLEKLLLKDCPSLSTVSHSIGSLYKLLLLNLTDCTGLPKLPRSIYTLKSLQTLILSGCSLIDKLEEDLEQMESLITLIADETAITKVPFSIVRLKSIGYISLSGFAGFSRDVFPSLIRSWMSPSNNVISLVQTSVSTSSLATTKDLPKLRSLCVECGSKQQLSRGVAIILDVLKATNCQKLEASASATSSQISDMNPSHAIDDSLGQVCTSRSNNHLKSFIIQMGMKFQVSNIAEDNILQTADGTWDSFLLSCDNESDWLTFSFKGCSIIFDVPTMKGSDLKSMMLFVVYYSSPETIASEACQGVLIINYTKTTIQLYRRDTLTSFKDEDWQTITSNLEPGNEVEVIVVFGEGFTVEKTTISLLYDKSINKEMEHCNAVEEDNFIVSGHNDTNVSVSGGYNIDVPADNNVTDLGQDENISEDKHFHAMDKNPCDDTMATNKKCACCFWWR